MAIWTALGMLAIFNICAIAIALRALYIAILNRRTSLRDYFAGQALAGIAGLSGEGFSLPEGDAARWAYQYADAMLAAREDE